MEELEPVGPVDFSQINPAQNTATSAFGLEFESLLQIVLTQLTFQDPLQPLENFEFVSQLAQFSQIQQTETMSDQLQLIAETEATAQATGLLGREVEIPAGAATLRGRVIGITFDQGQPLLSISTNNDQIVNNIGIGAVTRVEEGA